MVGQGRQGNMDAPSLPLAELQQSALTPIDAQGNSATIAPDLDSVAPVGRPSRSVKVAFPCPPTPGIGRPARAPPAAPIQR
jgi:hypothetical protein